MFRATLPPAIARVREPERRPHRALPEDQLQRHPIDLADVNPLYARWGARIVEARGKAMTQKALAEQVGVTQQTISRIERGLHGPGDGLRPKIAKVLGMKVEELFSYEEEEGLCS